MGTGGGRGESHACAVRGSFFVFIHAGQPELLESSSPSNLEFESLFEGLLGVEEKSKASLDNPTFFIANFAVKLESILDIERVMNT
ncbi:hypothetical protein RRF57_009721 [Xylaria bambusicola]|uniref:Uncharacterized protein n=1 Tax=Xylaria bambusicola TaxID=326684 RepID=A0AAN7UVF0_9PEZI